MVISLADSHNGNYSISGVHTTHSEHSENYLPFPSAQNLEWQYLLLLPVPGNRFGINHTRLGAFLQNLPPTQASNPPKYTHTYIPVFLVYTYIHIVTS